jgi:hypothetical protein
MPFGTFGIIGAAVLYRLIYGTQEAVVMMRDKAQQETR